MPWLRWWSTQSRAAPPEPKAVKDLERLGTKAAQGLANARDLRALGASLAAIPSVLKNVSPLEPFAATLPNDLLEDVRDDIGSWIVDEPAVSLTEGGIIQRGMDPELDELITLSTEGKTAIAGIEATEREATGITSLKIKHNKVFGYFLEVTQANLDRVPDAWIRKRTVKRGALHHARTEGVRGESARRRGETSRPRVLLYCALRERVGLNRAFTASRTGCPSRCFCITRRVAIDRRYVHPR